MEATCASFQLDEIVAELSVDWKMFVSGATMMLATSFSSLGWMLSGPADLLASRFESYFSTAALSMIILVI